MIDSFLRADVADMDHPFDTLRYLHESAEFGQADDRAFDNSPGWKFLRCIRPRIAESLLQAQRNAFFTDIDSENYRLYGFAGLHQIARLAHLLDPRHLRNVNQSFDTRLQLNSSEIGNSSHRAAHAIADLIFVQN